MGNNILRALIDYGTLPLLGIVLGLYAITKSKINELNKRIQKLEKMKDK